MCVHLTCVGKTLHPPYLMAGTSTAESLTAHLPLPVGPEIW